PARARPARTPYPAPAATPRPPGSRPRTPPAPPRTASAETASPPPSTAPPATAPAPARASPPAETPPALPPGPPPRAAPVPAPGRVGRLRELEGGPLREKVVRELLPEPLPGRLLIFRPTEPGRHLASRVEAVRRGPRRRRQGAVLRLELAPVAGPQHRLGE